MMTKDPARTFVCGEQETSCCPEDMPSVYEAASIQSTIEVYIFIDPLCPECWAMEPIIKKLKMEYGKYLSMNIIMANNLQSSQQQGQQKCRNLVKELAQSYNETGCRTGMPCDGNVWYENIMTTPESAITAVKAAELQGRGIGAKYLRRVREALFMHKENIADEEVLIACASRVQGLDLNEFKEDMHSSATKKAIADDKCTIQEMDIDTAPAFVLFSSDVEEPGVKIEGGYKYEVYENQILQLADTPLEKCPPQPLESFTSFYSLVATKEIAVVYDMTLEEAHKEMKKLQLQQLVEEIPTKHGSIWRSLSDTAT
ncbi:ClpXP adapter SpxH family protein [Alkalicoccus chagannorensis]|uniref:ClpXP adapter SpxH family protein n=1 Tax=Alkalicoccus chagannorensis TaxID=427072 RepID=UPI0003FA97C4|nr:ClpXP adapter SpxH family protein [Alkalicoccus chagannorensis]